MGSFFALIWIAMGVLGVRVVWIWIKRGGSFDPLPLPPEQVPTKLTDSEDAFLSFRCGFEIRAPRTFVCAGPIGRCLVSDEILALRLHRDTYSVVYRDQATASVTRGRLLTTRVHLTGDNIEIAITPSDWDHAHQMLRSAGWLDE